MKSKSRDSHSHSYAYEVGRLLSHFERRKTEVGSIDY
jgi:hypothetical protein